MVHIPKDLKSLSFLGIQLTETQEETIKKIDERLVVLEDGIAASSPVWDTASEVPQVRTDIADIATESADYLRRLRDLEIKIFGQPNEGPPPPSVPPSP